MAGPVLLRVYAIIRGIDPALRTLAVEGARRYAEVFDLVYRRQAVRPMRSGRPVTSSSNCGR
jgi:putative transposase